MTIVLKCWRCGRTVTTLSFDGGEKEAASLAVVCDCVLSLDRKLALAKRRITEAYFNVGGSVPTKVAP
jgi:hypothetical protein